MTEADCKIFKLIEVLREKAEFHRTNPNDPHGIGTACMVALTEVADAVEEASRRVNDPFSKRP